MRTFVLAVAIAAFTTPLISAPAWSQSDQGYHRGEGRSGIIARQAKMHAGPDNDYPSVRSFNRGLTVEIYGCLSDRSWCDIGYGPDRGWVSGYDLETYYQGRPHSIISLSASFGIGVLSFRMGDYWDNYYRNRPFYGDRYRWEQHYFENYRPSWGQRYDRSHWGDRVVSGYTLRKVWMRAGPDYDYPAFLRIGKGREVDIYGCLRDYSWCDVGYRSDRGWVPGDDLASSYQGRRRRINSIAPYLGIGMLFFVFDSYWDNHYRSRPFYQERNRWEHYYNDSYKPSWGPRSTSPVEQERQPIVQPRPQIEQKDRPVDRIAPVEQPKMGPAERARDDKAKEDKARDDKARVDKAKEDKAKQVNPKNRDKKDHGQPEY